MAEQNNSYNKEGSMSVSVAGMDVAPGDIIHMNEIKAA